MTISKFFQKAGNQQALIGVIGTIIGGVIATIGLLFGDRFLQAPELREKLETMTARVGDKDNLIASLEIQLVPFTTIAIQKYNSSDPDSMKKLAETMTKMAQDHAAALTTIARTQEELNLLKATTAPRALDAVQQEGLIEILSKIPGVTIVIVCRMVDGESKDFGRILGACIEKAGWKVSYNDTSLNDFKGLAIARVDSAEEEDALKALSDGLTSAGFPPQDVEIPPNTISGVLNGRVAIVVGRK